MSAHSAARLKVDFLLNVMVMGDDKAFWKIFRYFMKSRGVFLNLSTVDVVVLHNKRTIVL